MSAAAPARAYREWVPAGARLLGCRNCGRLDRLNFPELGWAYCAACPITIRQHALAQARARREVRGER